jgi:hypothetical protein
MDPKLTLDDFAKNYFEQVAYLHAVFFKKSMFAAFVPEVRDPRSKEILSEFFWSFTFSVFIFPITTNPLTASLKDQFFKDCLLRYRATFLYDHPKTKETEVSLIQAFTHYITLVQKVFDDRASQKKTFVLGRASESLLNKDYQKKIEDDTLFRLCDILCDGDNAILSNGELTEEMFSDLYREPGTDDVEKAEDKRAFYKTAIMDVFYQRLQIQVVHPIMTLKLSA